MTRRVIVILALILVLMEAIPVGAAGRRSVVYTDPEQAGPDFIVQGEYEGLMKTDEGEAKYGAQVIALGNGRFRAVAFHGGLPGAGWEEVEKIQANGRTEGDVTIFPSGWPGTVTIKDGTMTVTDAESQVIGQLKKIERKSPTLGAKPPDGAIVLFDGTNTDGFQNGRMREDGLLMPGSQTVHKFQDFTMHMEFQTSFMPNSQGQDRGNSGCYIQGRYELQILDSFGLDGRNNECGAIYTIAPPRENMCLPPLSWQTFDVEFSAAQYVDDTKVQHAKITVFHNGVEIHSGLDVQRVTSQWAPLREGNAPGAIYLQDHGSPVRFRNIWVVEGKIDSPLQGLFD